MFDFDKVKAFRYVKADFNETNGLISLCYALDDQHQFREEICFPTPFPEINPEKRKILKRALQYLHIMTGISYYKTACPENLSIETQPLSKNAAAFFAKIYQKGLAQFRFTNDLDLEKEISFPYQKNFGPESFKLELKEGYFLPIGGGKDSLVSLEILKSSNIPIELVSIGKFPVLETLSKQVNLPWKFITRKLSPHLFELNSQGALNGHVPVSAINSFILLFAGILYEKPAVVMSNEWSANFGNTVAQGIEVNHQYSKSIEFEKDFLSLVNEEIWQDFSYFSLLRPLSEIAIARLFAKREKYLESFSSCNSSFRLTKSAEVSTWCCKCPKCCFVFLILAPYLPKEQLLEIFGSNLLANYDLQETFFELAGLCGHKPFECVGDYDEVCYAFWLLQQNTIWKEDPIVKAVWPKISTSYKWLELEEQLFEPRYLQSKLPPKIEALLRKYIEKYDQGSLNSVFRSFNGQSILIWGTGAEGKAALKALNSYSSPAEILLYDDHLSEKKSDELKKNYKFDKILTGFPPKKDLNEIDYLIKSPGVSQYKPEITEAEKAEVIVTSGSQIWFDCNLPGTRICITGTKGKSTTASLIAHALKSAGHSALLAGNIGVPLLNTLELDEYPEYWVLELSSYQCTKLSGRADVALVLNLYDAHLNWHQNSRETYFQDKLGFLKRAESLAKLDVILNGSDNHLRAYQDDFNDLTLYNTSENFYHREMEIFYQGKPLGRFENKFLLGEHNLENICASLSVLKVLFPGQDPRTWLKSFESFKGLPHRLEYLGDIKGIKIYNDSIAVVPEASEAALKAIEGQDVTLILGGQNTGFELEAHAKRLDLSKVKTLIGLPDTGHQIIEILRSNKTCEASKLKPVYSMEEAVSEALSSTPENGAILLSPGAPSYNMFPNFIERAKVFANAIGLTNRY